MMQVLVYPFFDEEKNSMEEPCRSW